MATNKNKTQETADGPEDYIAAIADDKRRGEIQQLTDLFAQTTSMPPKMWGSAIIGFGNYHYRYDSGHEGDAPLVGLSSRANAITLYLGTDFHDRDKLLARFGKHKTGKSCIYVKTLADIDTAVLEEMIRKSVDYWSTGNRDGC